MHVFETEDFHAAVHALAPRVAVFDCDGTLWSGDAGSTFMHWTVNSGLVSPEAAAWLRGRYAGYNAGTVDELAICGEMVQVFAGIRDGAMRQAAEAFFAEVIERNIFPEMKQLVDELHAKDVEIWAVSSTCDWVIEEGVRRFGIPPERVLAARVKVVDGLVTDELIDVPTDEGKVASLKRMGITAPDAVFGNSVHDAAMLAIARCAFPVNPTTALMERSEREGWSVYFPASVRPSL
ncbi:Phosphoserine phosphatase [Granulicella pectinivorans]|jgi:phosphoserine phosphatase|uniref:Phosphoserine phosphatase n=1 Tax=Granulicella pectinivorans TaxID=474950 RepID=A0A1I6MJ55_9BACT|nr:haloacid dehalogenase-like hydrolase [Granulicella pectinivorans]SFS15724.1 Phosphoserine phosphatase [Granulicella pectinivorans]